ncbi:SsrA-binding protein [Sediminihabitans luteus]|uniref:SsrA-binding protein n=1 Tax=Sediminihabitans luteus TaxID=1138585 RepID=A0A2M9CYE1_9CELL|nr:SsrA-binding protein SmpB [Sediminihabitans luteus]PJJ76920.1 SsrA-binding protein [Sediminihabitans luteus]GII99561.1 SsrA-binding protein [Sediminihabitans luteus]
MAKDKGRAVIATNRKARHDYVIEDVYEAGIVLSGTEVKALRMGRASLADGYASIDNGEAWLENVHIQEYSQGTWNNHAPRRRRKLLLHKDEIHRLEIKTREKGHTLIPLQLYFLDGRVKVEVAVGRGKKEYDKRHALREKQDNREAHRAIRSRELR